MIGVVASILLLSSSSVEGFVVPQKSTSSIAARNNNIKNDVWKNRRREEQHSHGAAALFLSSVNADEFLGKHNTKSRRSSDDDYDSSSIITTMPTTTFSLDEKESTRKTTTIEEEELTAMAAATTTNTRKKFTTFQHAVRAVPILTTVSYLYDPVPLDNLVANIYSAIYNWDVAQVPLFEAEEAVFGFFAWIILFSSLHLVLGEQTTKESRFDGELPHKPFEWAEPQNFQLWFNPTASYLGSIWIYLTFLHEKPPLLELAPTFGVLAVETLFGVFIYDLCFMPIHYLMHNLKIGSFRKVHGYHHRSGNTLNALETVQHSYIDGFLQVFVNIMVQQISPFGGAKHVMSRLLHNLSVTYLLSEAHSGYRDLPWMSHNLFPEILGGAPRHEAHHHNGRVYYQQYFKYIDDFFGFVENEGDERKTIQRGVARRKKEQQEQLQLQQQEGNDDIAGSSS